MRSQRLWGDPFDSGVDVVRWLVAVQSQDFPISRWSIGQRTRSATEQDVDRAFANGAILRTHVLRPTWHFVLPEDIRWMLALTGPRVRAKNALYARRLGLDDATFAKSNRVLAGAVDGGHRTRSELRADLERSGIDATGLRLAFIVSNAELEALVCSGGRRGAQHTYASIDERAPDAKTLDRDEALAELARRYFASRGPATLHDLSWWSGLPLTDCRRGVDLAGNASLDHETLDGDTTGSPDPLARIVDQPRLASTWSRPTTSGWSPTAGPATFP